MVLLSRALKIGSITQVLVPLVLGFKDGVLDLIRLINFCVKLSPFLRFFWEEKGLIKIKDEKDNNCYNVKF